MKEDMMNLRSIEYFLMAVEEMNFTRASERLYISQQALSSHIKRLENEYNVQLFERKSSLHLTLEGEQMVFYCRQIMEAEAKMKAAFSDISKNCRGSLKLGISRLRGNVFFPLIWNHFHAAHPHISIQLIDGNSDTLDEQLQAGKIDFYIGVDVFPNPNLNQIELAHEKIQCCFSLELLKTYYPGYWQELLADFQNGVDLREIIKIPFVTLRRGNRLRKSIDLFFSNYTMPQFIFECDQQELIYDLAKYGTGAGLLSPVIFYQRMHETSNPGKEFYVFPVRNNIPENIVSLVYRKNYPISQYKMDFIQDTCLIFKNYNNSILNLSSSIK